MIWLAVAILSIVAYHLPDPVPVLLLVAGFACAVRGGESQSARWGARQSPPGDARPL